MIPMDRAIFDSTGKYRYLLRRAWAENHGRMCFIMLNPSTADANHDDPTVRSCVRLARQYAYAGVGAIEIVNLYAYCSTEPKGLDKVEDPIGPENDRYVIDALKQSSIIVAAWGTERPFIRNRAYDMRNFLYNEGFTAKCFGLTQNGSPRHPLYVANNTPLIPFR